MSRKSPVLLSQELDSTDRKSGGSVDSPSNMNWYFLNRAQPVKTPIGMTAAMKAIGASQDASTDVSASMDDKLVTSCPAPVCCCFQVEQCHIWLHALFFQVLAAPEEEGRHFEAIKFQGEWDFQKCTQCYF